MLSCDSIESAKFTHSTLSLAKPVYYTLQESHEFMFYSSDDTYIINHK